jgi:hypothetical protein
MDTQDLPTEVPFSLDDWNHNIAVHKPMQSTPTDFCEGGARLHELVFPCFLSEPTSTRNIVRLWSCTEDM